MTGIDAGSTGDRTFYAKWTAQKYTIHYNANGGKVKTCKKHKHGTQEIEKGKTYYVKVRAFKKDSIGNSIFGEYSNSKRLKVK